MKSLLHLSFLFFPLLFLQSQTEYLFPETGELLIEDCGGLLYDNGGKDSTYIISTMSTVTINGTTGDLLSLTFLYFDVENIFDNLYIYDGPDVESPLLGYYSGDSLPNDGLPIVGSTSTMTLVFDSDFIIANEGFEILFECLDLNAPPSASFSAPESTCNAMVSFSDASIGFPDSWTWDFGDGNTSNDQNPIHTYAVEGAYDVSLIACNSVGCDTFMLTEAVTYDSSDFACSNSFTMPSGHQTDSIYACQGVIYDPGGPSGVYTQGNYSYVYIEIPGATGIEFNFSQFDLGDLPQNYDQVQISPVDAAPGTFQGQYIGTDLPNEGAAILVEGEAALVFFYSDYNGEFPGFELFFQAVGQDDLPESAFSLDNTDIPFGTTVQFSDLSSNNPSSWTWDFGDGNVSYEQNPAHTYNTTGSFEVVLTVNNCAGESTSETTTITVQEAPDLFYEGEPFYYELNSGESTTGSFGFSNNGIGDLTNEVFSTLSNNGTGFVFEYEIDFFFSEFSYNITDADGNIVYTSENNPITTSSIYTDTIAGLAWSNSFTLNLFDTFGDGALSSFNVYDLASNDILVADAFVDGNFMAVELPAPTNANDGLWLDLGDGSAVLSSGQSVAYLFVIDASDLIGGTYETTIIIQSNDPDEAEILIPVTLVVTGEPAISISTSTLDFGDLLVGDTDTLSFTLSNPGSETLTIEGFVTNNPFILNNPPNDFSIVPDGEMSFELVFAPDAIGTYSETIDFVNNAGTSLSLSLSGAGLAAPSALVNPTALTAELISGEDTTLYVNLSNNGAADLSYESMVLSADIGFLFEFTTDNWGAEFSWQLLNENGEIVQASTSGFYFGNTTYIETISGLSTSENYTLQCMDSFGDGALSSFSISDLLGGQLVQSGAFSDGNMVEIDLGTPSEAFYEIDGSTGNLVPGGSTDLPLYLDATGLGTGTYNLEVGLTSNDPANPTIIVPVTLYVIAPVEAALTANTEFVCGNYPVNFSDASINVPTSWVWDFGDGNTSTEANPSHTYAADGIYTLSLTVCNSLGCDNITSTNLIEVELGCYAQNIPVDGETTITVCEGNLYDSGGPTGTYPEGNSGTTIIAPPGATNITITFTEFDFEEHGDYLYLYDGDNTDFTNLLGSFTGTQLQDTTITTSTGMLTLVEYTNHYINLNGFSATFTCGEPDPVPPVANFSVPIATVCANQAIVFNNETEGYTQDWTWDFGDGSSSTESNPAHIYTTSGIYTVTLTACNEFGCNDYNLDVEITIDEDCVIDNMPTSGTLTITDCNGTLYDSGGPDEDYPNNSTGVVTISPPGATSVSINFIAFDFEYNFDELIIYDGPDTTSTVLTVLSGDLIDILGVLVTDLVVTSTGPSITIQENTDLIIAASGFELNYSCEQAPPTKASFTGNLETMCSGKMNLYPTSDIEIDYWRWDFGNGHISEEQHPEHQFTHTGLHEIELIACWENDCDTVRNNMWVDALIPEITAPDTVMVGDTVHFHGMTEEATDWYWEMGNGSVSDHNAPYTIYTETGLHEVHVHLTNMNVSEECSVSHIHTVYVKAPETIEEPVNTSLETMSIQLEVFPNPTSDILHLSGLNPNVKGVKIHLIDMSGKTIWKGDYISTIDLSQYSEGGYVILLTDDFENQIFREIILKQ